MFDGGGKEVIDCEVVYFELVVDGGGNDSVV